MISIIIPVLDEAGYISGFLHDLQVFRRQGHELILVDGGSQDNTVALAHGQVDKLLQCGKGRARQMNHGASQASGELLLFLHADTRLHEARYALLQGPGLQAGWGRFNIRLSGRHPAFRMIEFCMNLRSGISHIATGDQVLFVRRELFEQIGGYPDISLMEDIAICRKLKQQGPPLCCSERVVSSSRRWEEQGILKTIVKMWLLRFLYTCQVNPERLARLYGY